MEKIWFAHYPLNTPHEINPDEFNSLVDLFEHSCANYNNSPAFHSLGTTLTYAQMDMYTRAFAAYLQKTLKLQKGERIAIMLPNVLQYPIAMFGALRAGLIVVNVNPLYTVPELIHQMQDCGADTILVLENFADTVEKALHQTSLKHVIVTQIGDLLPKFKATLIHIVLKYIHKKIPHWNIPNALKFQQTLQEGQQLIFDKVTLTGQDIAFLQYTGGTTGVSKGAMLTHRNLIANIEQAYTWFVSLMKPGKEIIITALPLYHIFSLMANCLFMVRIGGFNILIVNARDFASVVKTMRKFKFTIITGVNTLFNGLLKYAPFCNLNFSTLKLTIGGGMAVQSAVAEHWKEVTGVPISEAYGLTEASPCVLINPPDLKAYNGTVGLPVASTEVCMLDDAGREVPLGQPGELAIKGPQIMRGYWKNPLETKKVFTVDGWLLTGDMAAMDENGFVKILERKKDMILVSGFNVYPNEVEDVLAQMPGIREVAVVGVPCEASGEAVKAYVVRDNPALSSEDVIHFSHQSLTGYKVPKYVEFCNELPKTNVGKILRRALRKEGEQAI